MALKDDLRKAAMESAAEADALLEKEYNSLKKLTSTDYEKLKPQVVDKELLDKLIQIVQEATNNNLSLAEFEERAKKLGEGVVVLAKDIIKLL